MEEQDSIKALLEKYKSGTITDAEKAVLDQWYLHVEADKSGELTEEERFRAFDRVQERLEEMTAVKRRKLWPRVAAAASVLLCCGLGYYYFKPSKPVPTMQVVKTVIQPGSNKAVLTLASGQQINLSDAGKGQVANEAGTRISKNKNGQLTYEAVQQSQEIKYNTTTTPKGGQWHLVLQDGTQVWLNAASSLTYPTAFHGGERKVELTGEGYFEVAKDKAHPFVVSTPGESVRVLGTHFNISSYADEANTRTTLLEGSVKVNDITIKPGEQSVLTGNKIKVIKTDVDEAVAWKNGLFVFQQENIESVMRKLARWYDVEVVFDQAISDKTFTATIGRFDDIGKILHKITFTSGVHFKIEGRRITVSR